MKSTRLLLRNRSNLSAGQAVHLNEILAAARSLMTVYILRDELKRLWFYRRPGWAQRAWSDWFEQAQQSGVGPLQQFAQRLSVLARHCGPMPPCAEH
ncbi:transposase (plasmid) [Cupriavidus taiwanensis]|uniref:Transposase n=1 Tax=Cupriavidus taiwanensis TaxID=164546 RepID=A0A375ISI4_9BURK|nr:transposase [Cupriavidus taiwanensis]SPK77640.1 transposase [Cupriavidus taiwanensis]